MISPTSPNPFSHWYLLVQLSKMFCTNTVKDSFSPSNETRSKGTALYMDLFDIQPLFTNMPMDETIEIYLELLFYKKRKVKRILKNL